MYFAETARARIDRFSVDPATGDVSDCALFARVTGGGPDGMTVDDEDHLWVAVWGASEVRRFRPDGSLAEAIKVPTRQPSSVCLVGREDPRLFITTAGEGQTDPLAGALFAVPVQVPGRPADPYRPG
jgi:sugar lactone lactonase YvrE